MNIRLKRFLAVSLVGAMMLAACGKSDKHPEDTSDTVDTSQNGEGTPTLPQVPSGSDDDLTEPAPKDVYYVKFGSNGDGKSESNPAGSIESVISSINKEEYTADELVVVYIMRSEKEPDDGKWDSDEDSVFLTYPDKAECVHTPIIKYTSHGKDKAYLVFDNKYSQSAEGGDTMNIVGNTVFDNLNIIDPANSQGIFAQGHDLTIRNCNIYGVDKNNGYSFCTWSGTLYAGAKNTGIGMLGSGNTIVIDDATSVSSVALSGDYAKSTTTKGDILLKINGGTLDTLYFDGGTQNITPIFTGNITVVLNDTVVNEYKTNKKPSTSSSKRVTMILNGSSSIVNDSMSEYISESTKYIVKVGNGGKIGVADTAGTFSVSGGKVAYTVSSDGKTIYYGNEQIKLPTGEYKIEFVTNASEIASKVAEPTAPSGNVFIGWKDNGDGTMTPNFSEPVSKEYYVKDGGTGDGRSASRPAGYVRDVVKSINADGLKKGDVAKVYIMERDNVTTLDVGKKNPEESSFTAWSRYGANASGVIDKYSATLLITSYGYDGTDESMAHMAFSGTIGENANLILSGPTIFKNIKMLWPRVVTDRMIYTNGYEASFVNVRWMKTDAEYYPTPTEYHGVEEITKGTITMSASKNHGTGSVLRLETPVDIDNFSITIPGEARNKEIVDTEGHAAIYFDNADIKVTLKWGDTFGTTFKKGFSLVANDYRSITMKGDANNLVTVSGGMQIVNNAGKAFQMLPACVRYDKLWVLNTTDCKLDITDTVGTYSVPDGVLAVAKNNATGITYTSGNGRLTVPDGTYEVYGVAESALASKQSVISFDNTVSDKVYIRGTSVELPMLEDTVLKNFIGWSDGTKTYEVGELYTVPMTSTAALTSTWQPIDGLAYVYVCESGDDANSGADENNTVKTLSKAVELLNRQSGSLKKVIIVGNYKYSGVLPTSSNTIVYSGDGSTASAIELNNDSILLSGNSVFENIKLYSTTATAGKYFNSNGYSLTIGKGVTSTSSKIPLCINAAGSREMNILIESGSIGVLTVNGAAATGKLNIVINGASVDDLKLVGTFTSDVSVAVNDGALGEIIVSAATFSATFQSVINAGINTVIPSGISATRGVWIVEAKAADGCYLALTDTVGKYTVYGGKTAIANDGAGMLYGGNDVISLSAGKYSTEFVYKKDYLYSGNTISVLDDCNIDLSQIIPKNIEGKVFIGWKKNGSAVDKLAAHIKGDVLEAQYIDYNSETDFHISGTEAITDGGKSLAFTIDRLDSFTGLLPTIIESGALMLETDKTWGRDMIYNTEMVREWQWDGETKTIFTPKTYNDYMPEAIVANSFVGISGGQSYKVSVQSIQEKDYYTYYSVKGYIRFTDLNGIERIVYSDYYQTNLYKAALAKIEAEGSTSELEAIKTYVEVTRKELYMQQNYDSRTLLSGYPGLSDTNPNHAMYRLANGLNVREIIIDTGKAERDAVEIVMFADVHLNYINQKDMDLGEVRTLSTYRGRTWNRDGASVNNINLAMEYASFFDKTVVCGDIMDYFSWGCAEISQKLIFDKDDTVIATIGNHEPTETVQPDDASLKGTSKYTLEEHYERLSGFWPNDVLYHSEIICNDDGEEMAILVLMDNHRDVYVQKQYDGLNADIQMAKTKNIPILIFQHKPICTKVNETVKWFYAKGDYSESSHNWSNKFAGSSGSDAMTMNVYNLIVNNADVIAGLFCGDDHNHIYTEVKAKTSDGVDKMIPQHVVSANAFVSKPNAETNGTINGNVMKITIR